MKAAQCGRLWTRFNATQESRDRRTAVGLAMSFHVTIKDVCDWLLADSLQFSRNKQVWKSAGARQDFLYSQNAETSVSLSGNLLLPIQNTHRTTGAE